MPGGVHKLGTEVQSRITGKGTGTGDVAIDRTLGSRYELKYVMPPVKAKAVEQFVAEHLPKDRYSKLQPDGFYPIVSLYIDSQDLQLCRESINGKLNRFKLRIRSYTDDPAYPRFFEIKRRANTVIVKSRYRVKDKDVAPLLAGRYIHSEYYGTDENILRQFQLYVKSIGAGPMVLIKYLRKAYEGEGHNRVRVTFDKDLMYNVTKEPAVRLNCKGYQLHKLSLDKVILEIKFTGRYPEWLSTMAKHFELQQQSMSKYASSVRESCLLRFCAPNLALGF
jgi:hypothetical protein